jgi:hypothetical protein
MHSPEDAHWRNEVRVTRGPEKGLSIGHPAIGAEEVDDEMGEIGDKTQTEYCKKALLLSAINERDRDTDYKRKPHAMAHTLVIEGRSPDEKSRNEVQVRSDSHEDRQ